MTVRSLHISLYCTALYGKGSCDMRTHLARDREFEYGTGTRNLHWACAQSVLERGWLRLRFKVPRGRGRGNIINAPKLRGRFIEVPFLVAVWTRFSSIVKKTAPVDIF